MEACKYCMGTGKIDSQTPCRYCRGEKPRHLSKELKRQLYRAGRYQCEPPQVPPPPWAEKDWIKYIDKQGSWVY